MSIGNKIFKIEIASVSKKTKGELAHSIVIVWRGIGWCLHFLGSSWVLGCVKGGGGRKMINFSEKG